MPFCDATNDPGPKEVVVAVPVQIVTNIVQASGNAIVERRCPHCKKRLVTIVADGVSLSGCGGCGGIWIDNASARSVLGNPESVFADLARRCAAGATGSRGKVEKPTCAECPAILDRSRVHGIDLDTCAEHGTWFDACELETLVKILRHEPRDEQPTNAASSTVTCQSCFAPILANRVNIYGSRTALRFVLARRNARAHRNRRRHEHRKRNGRYWCSHRNRRSDARRRGKLREAE